MTGGGYDLIDALRHIPPDVHYDEYLAVGQALHHEGFDVETWRGWVAGCTQPDHAKRMRDIDRKWRSFGESTGAPITGGTLVKLARDAGWEPGRKAGGAARALRLDEVLYGDEEPPAVVDPAMVNEFDADVGPLYPDGHGAEELKAFVNALFMPSEHVGFITEYGEKKRDDGTVKLEPSGRGSYAMTAEEVCRKLDKGMLNAVGTTHDESGAWFRINPVDGKGIGNDHVAAFRYSLVESDDMEIGKFAAIVKKMNLPVAAMVYSGRRSLHAIVRVEASDIAEYKKRVETLYARCEANGIAIDKANKDASRMTRMPGVTRRGKRQYLASLSQGAADWEEWDEWYQEATDELPDAVQLDTMLGDNLPPLKPALIDGVLRVGHKMLVSGPSKAGKSFALISLCIAFAEGGRWLGMRCRQSKVMYVNLELDGDSCFNRFADIYAAMGVEPEHASNIDVWNLRGKAEPLGKLLPKLVRRCLKRGVQVVVIDPIYKVSTGDENNAGDMAAFANLFDELCDKAGVSAIYCHHHSKGFQGGKRSIDRASGSGVFGRDPDAILDMVELEADGPLRWSRVNALCVAECARTVRDKLGAEAWAALPDTARTIEANALGSACELLDVEDAKALRGRVAGLKERESALSAWRIEGTLREFPKFAPIDAWFDWPLHVVDPALSECRELGEEEQPPRRKGKPKKGIHGSDPVDDSSRVYDEINAAISKAVEVCREDGVEPTRTSIQKRIQEVQGKNPTYKQICHWTDSAKPWCEWVPGGYVEGTQRGQKTIVRRPSNGKVRNGES